MSTGASLELRMAIMSGMDNGRGPTALFRNSIATRQRRTAILDLGLRGVVVNVGDDMNAENRRVILEILMTTGSTTRVIGIAIT